MGILGGALTVRRFRVVGEVPEGFRDVYRDRMDEYAFQQPGATGGGPFEGVEQGKQELEGWVQVHNLLDTTFGDFNRWLYEPYALFALRVDKKTLPAKLLKAHLDKKCEEWARERNVDRCPASKRAELKEQMEEEWLRRTLPRVQVTELCWNMREGWLALHTLSEGMTDRVRRRFFQTFGLKLVPWSPLDWLEGERDVETFLATDPASLHGEA